MRPQYHKTFNPMYGMMFKFLLKGMFVLYNFVIIVIIVSCPYVTKFEYETKFGCESMTCMWIDNVATK